jgi:hypothetical protein
MQNLSYLTVLGGVGSVEKQSTELVPCLIANRKVMVFTVKSSS